MVTREQNKKSTSMPRDTMTTKRMSFQQQTLLQQQDSHHQQQQQQLRRPPDVEEALSSMLWTPYERASTTDTSSDEDDDEQLKCQLKKSKSQYDYTSVPTTIPPLTPPPPPPRPLSPPTSLPTLLSLRPASNAQHQLPPTHLASTNIVAFITTTPARVPAAAVPATSLISSANAYYTAEDLCDPSVTTPLVPFPNLLLHTTTPNFHLRNTATSTGDDIEGDDDVDGDNDDDDADDEHNDDAIVNAREALNDVLSNGNALAATSSSLMMMPSYKKKSRISSSYGRMPSLAKWWSTSNVISPPAVTTPSSSAANTNSTTDAATPKQPPSYESLYKKQTSRPLRQRHRLNKHLNLFKPVLETLKANVTTITQARFTSLQHTSTDHNRASSNRLTQPANVGRETTLTTASSETETVVAPDDNCSTESTSYNLVHSFTDNFLHEHCPVRQHVELTNVASEHIINNNNQNNNNNNSNVNINGETPQQQQTLIHNHQNAGEQLQIDTNKKSKQNQENENKQNNNFIICQSEQNLQQDKYTENTARDRSKREHEMNTNEFTNEQPESEHNTMDNQSIAPLYKITTKSTTTNNNAATLFYDSSSAISLTRSFEANTSYTFKWSVGDGSLETDVRDETRKTTTTTSYSLTPNKCLAELERLYAEFRASESLREQKLRESQNHLEGTATKTMRLNVPASTSHSVGVLSTEANSDKSVGETTRLNPSTSSVFLTTTNSVTTITNPCQRTPSLTIQVNQNNQASGQLENNESQMFLNQAIVNTTTNGVSVINCSYENKCNNNNNNNSKSITNLCDIATNTTNLSVNNINKNPNSPNHSTNLNKISKNISDHCSGSGNSDNFPHPPNNLVPQVLNITQDNQDSAKSYEKHLKNTPNAQVKVIQVNEVGGKATVATCSATAAPVSSPQRTFTSTECQTDDVQLRTPAAARPPLTSTSSANSNNTSAGNNRDQRRRERRERRHLQHTASLLVAPAHSHSHPHAHPMRHGHLDRHSMPAPPLPPILHPPHLHPGLQQTGHNVAMLRPMLPDILHHHFPPPYSALPNQSLTTGSGSMPHHNESPIPFAHPHPHPHHPPSQTPTATILGPPPPPPPAGTTLLTSVISTVPIPGATPMVSDGRFTLPLPIIRRSPSERSGKGCCGQWFAGPPLRALIAVVALGGVACALGGAALGATGLAGPPSSHFTAALLMIGVGVVLVTVSGAAWRMTAPGGPPCLGLGSSVDLGRCGRRPCSRGGGAPQGLLYPEFQHRPPPPSYQASMQEYRLRLLLLDRDRQNGVVRGSSPPPTYRSHAGSLLRAPLTSTVRGTGGGNRCESSMAGSEYSFPPSYRSRNTTPGTISSERSIETEPSGRLLANEDLPEPLSVEQLSEYNSLQQRCNNNNTSNGGSGQKTEQKRNSIQLDTNILISKTDINLNRLMNNSSDKKDDLVTIVTITPQTSDGFEVGENRPLHHNQGSGGEGSESSSSSSREQIEILAHL